MARGQRNKLPRGPGPRQSPPGGAQHRAAAAQRWAQAAFLPSPGRGRPVGTCPAGSRAPSTSAGRSPGAGPQGPRPC
eukprot:8162765-Alexandrium_andersonii.AAC.1